MSALTLEPLLECSNPGEKGTSLREVAALNIAIPPTFVVPPAVVRGLIDSAATARHAFNQDSNIAFSDSMRTDGRIIARSSAVIDPSLAPLISGAYASVVAESWSSVGLAVDEVISSFLSDEAKTRISIIPVGERPRDWAVLLQPYIEGELSGLARTGDSGNDLPPDAVSVAWTTSHLSSIASGADFGVAVDLFRLEDSDELVVYGHEDCVARSIESLDALHALYTVAHRVKLRFGHDVELEWVWLGHEIVLLQAQAATAPTT